MAEKKGVDGKEVKIAQIDWNNIKTIVPNAENVNNQENKVNNIYALVKTILGFDDSNDKYTIKNNGKNVIDIGDNMKNTILSVINKHILSNSENTYNVIYDFLKNVKNNNLLKSLHENDQEIYNAIFALQKHINDEKDKYNYYPINNFNTHMNNLVKQLHILQVNAIINKCKQIKNLAKDSVPKDEEKNNVIELFGTLAEALTKKLETVNKIIEKNNEQEQQQPDQKRAQGGGSMDEIFKQKYLKYKHKYLQAKKKLGL
jgi:hypothetical protein